MFDMRRDWPCIVIPIMNSWPTFAPTVLASFLASLVEFVEALTIILAVGVTRGWTPALLGTGAGIAALAVLVAALGSSLAAIPLAVLQLTVGVLLLMFGMRWLHKAVLRSAGVIPLHDEARIFSRQTQTLQAARGAQRSFDLIAFLASFKAVLLEGTEVVFVVVALGMNSSMLLPATAGALLAMLLVAGLGLALHRPLAAVPENTLKFAVGVMLTSFGTYWAGEGMGFAWPAGDLSILVLIGAFLAVAALMAKACARANPTGRAVAAPQPSPAATTPGVLSSIAAELLGLFVEDLSLAVGIAVWVGAVALAQQQLRPLNAALSCAIFAAGLAAVLAASAWRRARLSIFNR
jgi:uncharacterized membrane protein